MKELIYKKPFLCAIGKVLKHSKDEQFLNRIINLNPDFFLSKGSLQLSRKKTYYLIEQNWETCGFFAIMHYCLMYLCVADSMGFIPYINIRESIYNIKGGWQGIENMFEYYFQQPVLDTLERIKKEENYFLANSFAFGAVARNFSTGKTYEFDDRQLHYMGSVAQKYMNLRPELELELNDEITTFLGSKKTLGIHYRGSDFKLGFQDHPVALIVEQYFVFVDDALRNGFEQVFLATDDKTAVKIFRKKYGNTVVYYNDVMRTDGTAGIHLMKHEKEEDKYYQGREVLRDMITLSQCTGLIAGNSHVSEFARIWRYSRGEEFDYLQILSNGLYKKRSREAKQYLKEIGTQMNITIPGITHKK